MTYGNYDPSTYNSGKQVAKDLMGYTTREEQKRVVEYTKNLKPDAIGDFLKGYDSENTNLAQDMFDYGGDTGFFGTILGSTAAGTAAGAKIGFSIGGHVGLGIGAAAGGLLGICSPMVYPGNRFFEQVSTEIGFDEKQEVLHDVAGKLMEYYNKLGKRDAVKEIKMILSKPEITTQDAIRLDEITSSCLLQRQAAC